MAEFLVKRSRTDPDWITVHALNDFCLTELCYRIWLEKTEIKLKEGQTKKIEVREID
jgi:hypothetical protein